MYMPMAGERDRGMQENKHTAQARRCAVVAAVVLALTVASTTRVAAESIDVRLVTAADTYVVGESIAVDIVATTSSVLVAYGFDLSSGPELSYQEFGTGPDFVGVAGTPDGDGIVGLSFSGGVDGVDILLGVAIFDAVAPGEVLIELSTTPGDLTEGFAQFGSGFFDLVTEALQLTITAEVVPPSSGGGGQPPPIPEPATTVLLVSGLLATMRRNRHG